MKTAEKQTSAKQAVRMATLFHRHLQALINRVVPLATSVEEVKQSYHQMVMISADGNDFGRRQELMWWVQEVQKLNGAPLLVEPPDMMIESDASRLGWGATLKGQELRAGSEGARDAHQLSGVVSSFSGNTKEKIAINIYSCQNVQTTLYQALHKSFGGTHSWPMNALTVEMWKWCIDRQIFLMAEYIFQEQRIKWPTWSYGQSRIAAIGCFILMSFHRSRGGWAY